MSIMRLFNLILVGILFTASGFTACGGNTAPNDPPKPNSTTTANSGNSSPASPAASPGRGVPDSSLPDSAPSGGIYDRPEKVVEDIFYAAKAGRMSNLPGLCNPDGSADKDSKTICGIGSADDKQLGEFRKDFRTGKIVGAPEINGDLAKVKINFGDDGKKEEEFQLKLVKGRWYLQSF